LAWKGRRIEKDGGGAGVLGVMEIIAPDEFDAVGLVNTGLAVAGEVVDVIEDVSGRNAVGCEERDIFVGEEVGRVAPPRAKREAARS